MKFLFLKRQSPPGQLCVRDLEPGMVVPLPEGGSAKIKAISRMNGDNGERPTLIGGGGRKTAMAMLVEFEDHEPLIAHPGAVVKN